MNKSTRTFQTLLLLIIAEALLVGCVTESQRRRPPEVDRAFENRYYLGRATFLTMNDPSFGLSAKECCELAIKESDHPDWRNFAALFVFGAYVPIAATSKEMRIAIPDSRWVDRCRVQGPYTVLAGWLPLKSWGP